jgi:hypothetical protein
MFISYKYENYRYELTDSGFGTISGVTEISWHSAAIGSAVIQEYSKRNLNVAANLIRAFIWYNKKYPYFSIQELINFNKNHNPLLQQYEEDLQKYLVLL